MNTMNKSTGFTLFQLHFGYSLHLLSPLVPAKSSALVTELNAWDVIQHLEQDIMEAQYKLLKAKFSQSNQANEHHSLTFPFNIGSQV